MEPEDVNQIRGNTANQTINFGVKCYSFWGCKSFDLKKLYWDATFPEKKGANLDK